MSEDGKHCGCNSNGGQVGPRESVLNSNAAAEAQTTLKVGGMDCADEVEAIHRALKPLDEVREVRVDLMNGKLKIAHDSSVNAENSSKPSQARD